MAEPKKKKKSPGLAGIIDAALAKWLSPSASRSRSGYKNANAQLARLEKDKNAR